MCLETWQVEYNFLIPKLHEGKAQVLQRHLRVWSQTTTIIYNPDVHLPPFPFLESNSAMYTEVCREE